MSFGLIQSLKNKREHLLRSMMVTDIQALKLTLRGNLILTIFLAPSPLPKNKVKSKTKVVITPGIIELGSASARVHQEIAQALREKIDLIILTNDNFLADFKKGMGKSKTRLIVENKPKKIRGILSQESPKITVLLEGRLP